MSEEQKKSELDLQQAVLRAVRMVHDLYEAQGYQLNDVLLEEVQRSNDTWLVTVGFTRPAPPAQGPLAQALAGPRRAFKRVKIDANTGDFLGMEIRELQAPSQPQQLR